MPSTAPDASFASAENNSYPGYRLGYPEDGPGSIGGIGRRIGGLVVDWIFAMGLGNLFFGGDPVALMGLFVVVTTAPIMLFGSTLGHRLFGLQLTRLDGSAPGPWRPLVRQLLLVLVIPAAVWDSDHRGGHDILTRLALRRR